MCRSSKVADFGPFHISQSRRRGRQVSRLHIHHHHPPPVRRPPLWPSRAVARAWITSTYVACCSERPIGTPTTCRSVRFAMATGVHLVHSRCRLCSSCSPARAPPVHGLTPSGLILLLLPLPSIFDFLLPPSCSYSVACSRCAAQQPFQLLSPGRIGWPDCFACMAACVAACVAAYKRQPQRTHPPPPFSVNRCLTGGTKWRQHPTDICPTDMPHELSSLTAASDTLERRIGVKPLLCSPFLLLISLPPPIPPLSISGGRQARR